jgi:hypothetical protein
LQRAFPGKRAANIIPAWVRGPQKMRRNWPPYRTEQDVEAIATFGQAKLIRQGFENDYELLGGSEADRAKAKEWIALFMKDSKIRGLE